MKFDVSLVLPAAAAGDNVATDQQLRRIEHNLGNLVDELELRYSDSDK